MDKYELMEFILCTGMSLDRNTLTLKVHFKLATSTLGMRVTNIDSFSNLSFNTRYHYLCGNNDINLTHYRSTVEQQQFTYLYLLDRVSLATPTNCRN